ncbi:alpha/beta hydrolase [Alteromonas aestuariivivens]|uniref:Alpha/beta hydrolase n=1 Tax=Alteromonas aestuariivivens TaxID=1938339 RepID=A0A3D8ME96_9ALTE|nr:alpha/beta hydrolase [Alteromonas aestuariivivens]RDV28197.1 alpha/beta hydrolase [Alteromonas aestuariivivens]
MLFITNREPQGSIRTKKNRPYKFDLNKNAPSNSIYCCERVAKDEYIELGHEQWLDKLKSSPVEQLVFLIHGFSNLPEPDIFPRAQKLQSLFNKKKKDFALVVPVIWPCDNDKGIVGDYWDDQMSADMSAFSFGRALEFFMHWRNQQSDDAVCLKRINVLAHSMGNRVFRQTLAAWNKYSLVRGVPLLFRNSFLVAADVVNETLEEHHIGRLIAQASRNVSVYFASDDLALRASKISNLRNRVASRRLGHSGPEDMSKTLSNVFAIDCDNFNIKYDPPKGHSYFLEDDKGGFGAAFEHIYDAMLTGRVDVDDKLTRRKVLGTARKQKGDT